MPIVSLKPKLFILLYALVSINISIYRESKWKSSFYEWDKANYHLYLPAALIYGDITQMRFYDSVYHKYLKNKGVPYRYSIYIREDDKLLNKYGIGTALLESPFFIVAHIYTLLTQPTEANGFTHAYEWGTIISTIFWVVFGLYFLLLLLNRYFSENVTLFTLICIGFGTNLYCYTAFDQGMSHSYSFSLFSLFLYLTDTWYLKKNKYTLLALSIVFGLITIVRPSNTIVISLFVFWKVQNISTLKARAMLLWYEKKQIVFSVSLFVLVCFLQMLYWKSITGKWIYFSYEGEYFNFLHPRILSGLFSFRKGWFIYTPIAFIAMLGFYHLWKKNRACVPALLVQLTIAIYIIFSWQCWWYGGSFGCRPMIEYLALLSLPLAAFIEYSINNKYLKYALIPIVSFFIFLNIFQTYQFSKSIISTDRMTKAYYLRVFLRTETQKGDSELLMSAEDWAEEDKKSYIIK